MLSIDPTLLLGSLGHLHPVHHWRGALIQQWDTRSGQSRVWTQTRVLSATAQGSAVQMLFLEAHATPKDNPNAICLGAEGEYCRSEHREAERRYKGPYSL